jgi:hypothetical protein
MRVRFQDGARAGAVEHDRDAVRCVMAGIGVERHALDRHVDTKHRLGVVTDRGADGLPSGLRRERRRKQQPLDVELDLAEGLCGGGDPLAQIGLDRGRVLLRNDAAVEPEADTVWNDVGGEATLDRADADGDLIPVIREVLRARDGRCR